MTHPWFDHPGPIAIAHRGGAGVEPENTMRAFRRAVDEGYRWLETDVHATADGHLVAFHDASLDRVTDRSGRIADLPWSEVREARVAGTEPIPLLTELLEEFPDARFSVDAKADAAVDPLLDVIGRTGALDRVCFGAFSDARLRRIRSALGAGACVGLGPTATGALAVRSSGFPVPVPTADTADCVQPPFSFRGRRIVTRRYVETAHRLGLAVVVWTVDDEEDMRRALDLGVDAVITDEPGRLRAVLESRGDWYP
ncbi:MAG: glycerophosphodiester phosphodiesterase [Actinomycetota bacterium]